MKSIILILSLIIGINAQGSLLSNSLGSNMVLQRAPQQATIWGWTSSPSATVSVLFNRQSLQTVSSATTNAWSLQLPATSAGGPYNIDIKTSDGEIANLTNILFGDVWICSGQSNMQFTVPSAFNASASVNDADNYPNIRVFTVGQGTISLTPLTQFSTIEQGWSVASSSSVGVGNWSSFSATCWFTAKNLYDRFGVPLGLVSSNWGGTYVQAWSSPNALAECPSAKYGDMVEHVTYNEEEFGVSKRQANPNQPSVLWNAMIVPLLPMRVTGTIWYQAEANVGADSYYACAFPAMITDWRAQFGYNDEDFPFFFVQLAPYVQGNWPILPQMRIAQTAALNLNYTGMAVTVDIGDPYSPFGIIHPRDKEAVGVRLSLAIRAIHYGDSVQFTGPTFQNYTVVSAAPNVQVSISFVPSSIGSGLVAKSATCPNNINGITTGSCGWAAVLTSDNNWNNATITIQGNNLIFSVVVASNLQVNGVSYLYNDWPVATIFNKEGLPAAPFISTPGVTRKISVV